MFFSKSKYRCLTWIASLYSFINEYKWKLTNTVWIMHSIFNNMFSWKNIHICAATARMWIFFGHLTFLLANFIHLMQNSMMHFLNINVVLLIQYYRFYSHLRSEKAYCTNKNILLMNYYHKSHFSILKSLENLLSVNYS